MAALKPLIAAALLLPSTPAGASPIDRWHPFIADAAQRFDVPENVIVAVMRAESGGQTRLGGRPITSPAGAMGLMQLMPATWGTLRAALRLGPDPYDPHDNIFAGTLYLRQLRDRFGYPGMIAAYNAGPARYAAYLAGRRRLPRETVAYLGSVTGRDPIARLAPDIPPHQLVFVLRHDLGEPAAEPPMQPAKDSLFAIRKAQP